MAWFEKKSAKTRKVSLRALNDEQPKTPGILDGDENAVTPVEQPKLGKLAKLNPFSPVALSLIRHFDRDDADIKEIVNLVSSDPALSVETLAYVNSPLFSFKEVIS